VKLGCCIFWCASINCLDCKVMFGCVSLNFLNLTRCFPKNIEPAREFCELLRNMQATRSRQPLRLGRAVNRFTLRKFTKVPITTDGSCIALDTLHCGSKTSSLGKMGVLPCCLERTLIPTIYTDLPAPHKNSVHQHPHKGRLINRH